jgi:hypothetical protein
MDDVIDSIGIKLDSLSKVLNLHPYSKHGAFLGKLNPVSEDDIAPVYVICPESMECETYGCDSHSIIKKTKFCDTSMATLIKGTKMYEKVPVLVGQCPNCKTGYHADHERSLDSERRWMKLYLNSAKYLKVGQSVWVNRCFSESVLNAVYCFHASTSAFTDFWNSSFYENQNLSTRKLSRRQVWHTFVQESVRRLALASETQLELQDRLTIDEVTKQAFEILGEKGLIRSADGHSCSECTHNYKAQAERIPSDESLLGRFDGNQETSAINTSRALQVHEEQAMDIDDSADEKSISTGNIGSDEYSPVKMVVVDGIVMGDYHCAFQNCISELVNNCGGVFCQEHEAILGKICRVKDCQNPKASNIHTCHQHEHIWHSHVQRYGKASPLGIKRLLRRSEEESLPWLQTVPRRIQPHDEPTPEPARHSHYFVAPRFYCVETICAPCGVVIAWTKFARAESLSNILNFLDRVYPSADLKPDYVCIVVTFSLLAC